jgi:RNA-directed DNA polymerase
LRGLCSFENLDAAYHTARRGKRARAEVAGFELRYEEALLAMRRDLLAGTYCFGPYREFTVLEPKERLVAAAPFGDRVVHHALVNVLEPIWEPHFIHDTYACRREKGTHRAVLRCQEWTRRHSHALKADIWKFYPTVDHEVLLGLISRRVRDPRVLALVRDVLATWTSGPEYYRVFAGDDLFSLLRPRGIPIGNLTSQFFANVHLAALDDFVKRNLGVRAYVRYMDDLLLFADDPATLRDWQRELERALEPLRLALHPLKCQVIRTRDGVPFLGFRVLPGRRLLLRAGVRRFVRRTRRQMRQVEGGECTPAALGASVRGWVAHATHTESRRLRASVFRRLRWRGGGWVEPVVPGAAGRLVEQQHEQPAVRLSQQQQPEQSQQQQRVPLCEDVSCRNPGRRGDPERAPNVNDLFPAREGQREQDGSPRGRPLAEAWRPVTSGGGA